MEKLESKAATGLMLTMLLASMLSMAFVIPVKAQYAADPHSVALWHFDEVTHGVTPDATGENHATLGGTPPPMLVEGKFGKALEFDGRNFAYVVPIYSSLDISSEITIDAWINVKAFTNATYNNIVVKCARAGVHWQTTSRMYGLAVKAGLPEGDSSVPTGALRGYVSTDTGGFNEIVTTEPVISLNQWIHVAFRRSLATGMHIYVNGVEKNVKAISGVQNPQGSIENGPELYFGHDAEVVIDEVQISSAQKPQIFLQAIEIGPNLLLAVIIIAVVFAMAWLLRRVIQTWAVLSKSKN